MSTLFAQASPRTTPPFRNDVVGSFLRPEALKKAREAFKAGKISQAQLNQVVETEIAELVEKEAAHGLHAVTDGEFSRSFWHLDFLAGLDGVEEVKAEHFSVQFKDHSPKSLTLNLTGKIDFSETHPFIKAYQLLKEAAGNKMTKFTIPSPSMLHLITHVRPDSYTGCDMYAGAGQAQLMEDLSNAYIKAMKTFYDMGLRYLQLDDTSWGQFCAADKREEFASRGIDLDQLAKDYVAMINRIIAAKPKDMTITMHICRGNFRSTWFSSGGYEPVAETLFGGCHVDGFFLEYDSDRAGDFQPLRFIKNQQVVLGLITSKSGDLENKDDIISRIKEAAEIVDINQLCLSPQCGFASTEEGNILTEAAQWKKLDLIKEIADEVWG